MSGRKQLPPPSILSTSTSAPRSKSNPSPSRTWKEGILNFWSGPKPTIGLICELVHKHYDESLQQIDPQQHKTFQTVNLKEMQEDTYRFFLMMRDAIVSRVDAQHVLWRSDLNVWNQHKEAWKKEVDLSALKNLNSYIW
jgi:hypothetical protein